MNDALPRRELIPVAFRLRRDLYKRLKRATVKSGYRLTQIAILERGLQLALDELEERSEC